MFLKLTQSDTLNESFVWINTAEIIAVAEANDGEQKLSTVLLSDGNQYRVKESADWIVARLR